MFIREKNHLLQNENAKMFIYLLLILITKSISKYLNNKMIKIVTTIAIAINGRAIILERMNRFYTKKLSKLRNWKSDNYIKRNREGPILLSQYRIS